MKDILLVDDLKEFKTWWESTRIFNTPKESSLHCVGIIYGVVLYRQGPYQVQLFILPPNSVIEPHTHPNVDSFEVFIGGDIEFSLGDETFDKNTIGDSIRVAPTAWHGGKFGPNGGCFLSIQKWLNGVAPTSVGHDWYDSNRNTTGSAKRLDAATQLENVNKSNGYALA
jgi:quercetin dioxygenase-like cupin family protein